MTWSDCDCPTLSAAGQKLITWRVADREHVHPSELGRPAQQLPAKRGDLEAGPPRQLALQARVCVRVRVCELVVVGLLVEHKHEGQYVVVLVPRGLVVEDALGGQPLPGRPAGAPDYRGHPVA
eukprot:scaffold125722_cov45-Prasinocladus_malaysianus.AAC.1